ncbi:MAG: hypothetical protein FWC97_07240 [Treponema sp.]|nr:hypothetical protein [Treponema sp.]
MAELTEEEYDALDEYYTKNPPKINPLKKGTGYYTKRKAALSVTVDSLSASYLLSKAMATHKTPAEIVRELVQKELALAI